MSDARGGHVGSMWSPRWIHVAATLDSRRCHVLAMSLPHRIHVVATSTHSMTKTVRQKISATLDPTWQPMWCGCHVNTFYDKNGSDVALNFYDKFYFCHKPSPAHFIIERSIIVINGHTDIQWRTFLDVHNFVTDCQKIVIDCRIGAFRDKFYLS